MDYQKLVDIGSKVSLAVVLMVILYGNIAGYWVSGSTLKDVQADRDTWKNLALKGANVAAEVAHPVAATLPVVPLPTSATADDVNARLDSVKKTSAYKTEPTDAPL